MRDELLRKLCESWKMCEVQTEIDFTVDQYIRKIENASDFQKAQYMKIMVQQATDKISKKFQLDEIKTLEVYNVFKSKFL